MFKKVNKMVLKFQAERPIEAIKYLRSKSITEIKAARVRADRIEGIV